MRGYRVIISGFSVIVIRLGFYPLISRLLLRFNAVVVFALFLYVYFSNIH